MIYLELDELLHVAERALGFPAEVLDHGLLETSLARPQATAFGELAYPTIHEQAAALLHSVARNRALVDGDKRLALGATIAFYGMNGWRLTLDNDAAYTLVMDVASGSTDDVAAIAERLANGAVPPKATLRR